MKKIILFLSFLACYLVQASTLQRVTKKGDAAPIFDQLNSGTPGTILNDEANAEDGWSKNFVPMG